MNTPLVIVCAALVFAALAPPLRAQETPPVTTSPSASAPVASADAKARAKEFSDEGRAHYELGRFAEALASFEKAHEALPLPALLFNIGQCHFQQKRYDRAVFFYERYLELMPEASNRKMVQGLIAEAKGLDASSSSASRASRTGAPAVQDDDGTVMVAALGAGAVVALAAGVVTWVLWTSPPAPGSLGLIDRRTPAGAP